MPHKIATFFRSHASSLDSTAQNKEKKAIAFPSIMTRTKTVNQDGTISPMHSTDLFSTKWHSLSINLAWSSPEPILQQIPAKLDIEIESPPLVYFGSPAQSSGALLSGRLRLDVLDEAMIVESLQMRLALDVKMKIPFHAHCAKCTHQSTDLKSWKFLQTPRTFNRGKHDFPFGFLLSGHLPATMLSSLSSIQYTLGAQVTPKIGGAIALNRALSVKRSIQPPEPTRKFIRIFPPTNLKVHVDLPSVIHPIGEFKCSLRVIGIAKHDIGTQTQVHWKLKRLTWRVEEMQKVISPACPKHAAKAGAGPDEKKGVAHQNVKNLNMQELKNGWKADYTSVPDAFIELDFPFSVRADSNPQCDVKTKDGTEISNHLVIELNVFEEFAPISRPSRVTQTGETRVLRVYFNLPVTERGGLGVSWDEEQPPIYSDVAFSPPQYKTADE